MEHKAEREADYIWKTRPILVQSRSRDYKFRSGLTGNVVRLGRAISQRLPNEAHQRQIERALHHAGPYMPIIFEACQEGQLSYEYRHGSTSNGAFTYSLAAAFRDLTAAAKPFTFKEVNDLATKKLAALSFAQQPNLVWGRRPN